MKIIDKQRKNIRIPVWVYHNVGPVKSGSFPGLTMEQHIFRKQILWLNSHGYTPISSHNWMDWIKNDSPLPPKPILLTFDDAYLEITKYALPILEEYEYSSLVFVVSDLVGKTNVWDSETGYTSLPLMSEDDIIEWSNRGVEFGAHTCSHLSLTEANETSLLTEIISCRDKLQEMIKKPIFTFAYPYGNFNDEICSLVKEQYLFGFSLVEGINTASTDLAILKRTTLLPWDSNFDLFFRAHFGFSPIKKLRSSVRIRTRIKKYLVNKIGVEKAKITSKNGSKHDV